MNTKLTSLFPSFLIVTLVALGMAPAAWAADHRHPPGNRPVAEGISAEDFMAAAANRGFEVAEGGFRLWAIEDCPQSYEVTGTCYFNNPTAPYVMGVVPHWPDEYVDPATIGAFGATEPGYGTTFRLDPNEAIVIFGILPPEAAYFGLQSYLFTRKGGYEVNNATYRFIAQIGATGVFFHPLKGNPERVASFDSLSNSNNDEVIERQSGGSFGELRYFVITPDRSMNRKVRQILRRMSVAAEDIFTERIPANMQLGLDEDADDFVTGIRYSLPADGGAEGTPSDSWRHAPTLSLVRVRDPLPRRSRQPYPAWTRKSPERRTATPEAYLSADLARLLRRVSETWGQPCAAADCSDRAVTFIDTQSYPFNLIGPRCAEIGMDCVGDTQDASYQFVGGLGFDAGEVYAVAGSLGTATGNATYVSLGVNNFRLRLGAKNVDGSSLVGSADPSWYPDVDQLDQLYVFYFTRNCDGLENLTHGFCLSVEDSPLVIPVGDRASLVERDYMRPGTQRGPNSKLLLPSRVLRLQRPAP
jgi:hypothetical protein